MNHLTYRTGIYRLTVKSRKEPGDLLVHIQDIAPDKVRVSTPSNEDMWSKKFLATLKPEWVREDW